MNIKKIVYNKLNLVNTNKNPKDIELRSLSFDIFDLAEKIIEIEKNLELPIINDQDLEKIITVEDLIVFIEEKNMIEEEK